MTNIFEAGQSSIDNDNASPPEVKKTSPRKLNLGNDKDRAEYFTQLRDKAIANLYKGDPLIRQCLDAQAATEASKTALPKNENISFDQSGMVKGVHHSVVRGVHATGKNQKSLMEAIMADVNKRYGLR